MSTLCRHYSYTFLFRSVEKCLKKSYERLLDIRINNRVSMLSFWKILYTLVLSQCSSFASHCTVRPCVLSTSFIIEPTCNIKRWKLSITYFLSVVPPSDLEQKQARTVHTIQCKLSSLILCSCNLAVFRQKNKLNVCIFQKKQLHVSSNI